MSGRPAQYDAEYFPFYAKDGRTLFMLQENFGLEGIGFFTNLLRLLCTTPRHVLDLSDPVERLYTWSKIGMKGDWETAEKMIALMVKTGKIDADLWEKSHVVYSQDFVDSLEPLYAKRKSKPASIDDIRGIYSISVPETPISVPDIPGNANNRGNNTQSKVSKVKEREFDGKAVKSSLVETVENSGLQLYDDLTEPTAGLVVPEGICQRFTDADLAELKAMFNGRSQEALNAFSLYLDAGDYKRFSRPWSRVKTWLLKEVTPQAWLDRATGKPPPESGSLDASEILNPDRHDHYETPSEADIAEAEALMIALTTGRRT